MIGNDLIKTRILVIGSNGMLGQRLSEFFMDSDKFELMCTSFEDSSFIEGLNYKQLDITQKNKVREVILDFFPDYIINAAAFTNVDKSETEKENAWKINVNGVENISLYSWTVDAHLIHISSDYIFDGQNGPYTETAKPCPLGYYGRTKLASENSVKVSGVRYTIIRTNVLYGPAKYGRPDFVKWVVDSLRSGKKINIVTDQINNPTYIDDLAGAINKIIEFKKEGIFNIAGKVPIITEELKQAAPRPLKSGLVTLKAETELNYKPRSIEETLILMKDLV